MPIKRRRGYTIEFKLSVLADYKPGVPGCGFAAVASKFGVSKSVVIGWYEQRDKLAEEPAKRQRRRLSRTEPESWFPSMEERLEGWILERNNLGRRVRDADIIRHAKQLLSETGDEVDFAFSTGWLRNFKRRFEFTSRRATRTRMLPNDVAQTSYRWIMEVREFIEKHGIERKNIINMDQVPRYFQAESQRTNAKRGAQQVVIANPTTNHKRFTATFTVCASGEFMKPHLLFGGRSTLPDVVDGVSVTVNKTGMWNTEILRQYMRDYLFARHDEVTFECPPTLLLVDSYGSHVKMLSEDDGELESRNVFVKLIPPNLTPVLQPLDVVINKSFQDYYNSRFELYMDEAQHNQALRTKADNVKVRYMFVRCDSLRLPTQMPTPLLCSQWVVDWMESFPAVAIAKAFDLVGLHDGPFRHSLLHDELDAILASGIGDAPGPSSLPDDASFDAEDP